MDINTILITEPKNNSSLLQQHLIAVRKIPGLESSIIVFIPESNLGFEAIWCHYEIRRSGLDSVCVMQEDDNRAGVRTNKALKKMLAISFNYRLLSGRIFFHRRFVCTGEQKSPEGMKRDAEDQLLNYSRIIRPSNDPYAQPNEIYSGKGGNGTDDLAFAMQLNPAMKERFWERKDKYKDWYQ